MPALDSALKRLAEGQFICTVHFPEEYEALDTPEGRTVAERWLGDIGYRLARLHDEGAYFMAHAVVTTEMRAGLREQLRAIRSRLEPVVGFMEALRQAQGRDPRVHAGDMIWESEISEAVRNSSLLEQRIMDMREISGARLTDSVNDRVHRMLEQLQADGYVLETNPTNRGYQVTGKVDYLYQMISFIAANTAHLSDDEVVDQIENQPGAQGRLDAGSDAVQTVAGAGDQGQVSSGEGPQ